MPVLVDPHGFLAKVHPDLARVLVTAEQLPQRFIVIQGLRTLESEAKACASGHSQTMHSRHLACGDGLARAVDIAALAENGHLDWAENHEAEIYGQIAKQVLAAAALRGVSVSWGGSPVGAWEPGVPNHFYDWGHFQLPWGAYPE